MPLRYCLRKGFFMFNYYIRLNYKEKIHKTAEFRVINIYDNRFPYVELRNPFEINSEGGLARNNKNQPVYLHPKLNHQKIKIDGYYEKHKNDVVYKTHQGTKLKLSDFYEPCYNAVNISFLEQLTLQVSKLLNEKISDCITENSFLALYDNFPIKKDGFCYLELYTSFDMPKDYLNSLDRIAVKWKSNIPDVEYVEMSQEVSEKDLSFYFCDIEEEKFVFSRREKWSFNYLVGGLARLTDFLSKSKENPYKTEPYADEHFINILEPDCLASLNSYPDITFKLCWDYKLNNARIVDIKKHISDFVKTYNRKHSNKIHYFDVPSINDQKYLIVAFDFGLCQPNVIMDFVKYINNANPDISQIKIK